MTDSWSHTFETRECVWRTRLVSQRQGKLVQKIDAFVQHYNRSSRPFVWTATADSILEKDRPTLFTYFRDILDG